MSAINGLVADLLEALPAPPSGCDPTTHVSYGTRDAAVLERMAADHPGGRHEPGRWVAWNDYGVGISVQVSLVGEPDDDEQERKRLSDSAAAAEDFHVEDDGGDEEDPS